MPESDSSAPGYEKAWQNKDCLEVMNSAEGEEILGDGLTGLDGRAVN